MFAKINQPKDALNELPDELLVNVASLLGGNFFNFMSASTRTLSTISPELKKTCTLVKKFFPQYYSWFYQFFAQQFSLTRRQFSFEQAAQAHCDTLINMIKSRMTSDIAPTIAEYIKRAGFESKDIFTQELEKDLFLIVEKITATITWEQIVYLEKLNQLARSSAPKLMEEEFLFYDESYLNSWVEKHMSRESANEAQDSIKKLLAFINKTRAQLPVEEIKQKIESIFDQYQVSPDEYFANTNIHFLLNFSAHKEYIKTHLKSKDIAFNPGIYNNFEKQFKKRYCPRENNSYLLNARRDIRDELKSIFAKQKFNAPYYFITDEEEFYKHWDHHVLFIKQLDIPLQLKKIIFRELEELKALPDLSTLEIKEKIKIIFDKYKIQYGEYFIRNENKFLNWEAHAHFIDHLDLDKKRKQSLRNDLKNLQTLSQITMPSVSEKDYNDEFFPVIETYKSLLSNIMKRYEVLLPLPAASHELLDFKHFNEHLDEHLNHNLKVNMIRLECSLLHQITLRSLIYKSLFNLLIALGRHKSVNVMDFYYHFLNTTELMPRITEIVSTPTSINLKLPLETYFSLFRDFLEQKVDFPLNDAEYLLWDETNKQVPSVFKLAKMYDNQWLLNALWLKHGAINTDELMASRFWDFDKVIDDERKINLLQWKVTTNQSAKDVEFNPENRKAMTYTDSYGNTLLHYAALNKDLSWLKIFIDATIKIKLSLNAQNKNGQSPLIIATVNGNYAAVDLLLESGAVFEQDAKLNPLIEQLPPFAQLPPSMACSLRITPLHIIVRHLPLATLDLLESKWLTEINVQNRLGQTPLHIALDLGDKAKIKWLLDHGADISIKDKFGLSIVDYLFTGLIESETILNIFSRTILATEEVDLNKSLSQAIRLQHYPKINLFLTKPCSINIKEYFEILNQFKDNQSTLNQTLLNSFRKGIEQEPNQANSFNVFFSQLSEAVQDKQIKNLIKIQQPKFLINLLALAKIYKSFSKAKNLHKIEKIKLINSIVEYVILGTPLNLERLKFDKTLYKIASSLLFALDGNNNNNNMKSSQTFAP